jgi:hypothetical protein
MALIVLCSAHGSPGVTTTALAAALTWPRDVVLVDADRDPSQAVLAGFLQGTNAAGAGLPALAQANRDGADMMRELDRQGLPLTDAREGEPSRRFVPGFLHPGSAALFDSVWLPLAEALQDLGRLDMDALVDAGRIGRDGLPRPLVALADRVLVVTRSTLPALAAVALNLPSLSAQHARTAGFGQVGLVIVGPGMPYSAHEIAAQFATPVVASLPWAPKDAAVLADGVPARRDRLTNRPLLRAVRAFASTLSAQVGAQADQVMSAEPQRVWQPDREVLEHA